MGRKNRQTSVPHELSGEMLRPVSFILRIGTPQDLIDQHQGRRPRLQQLNDLLSLLEFRHEIGSLLLQRIADP